MDESGKTVSLHVSRARLVFISAMIIAFIVIYAAGSHVYFYSDDWTMFQQRSPSSLSSWLEPHYQVHWIPGLVALYGVLFNLLGIDYYWLYRLPGVVMHLLAAGMLRKVMLNADADEWTATACAVIFAFYGIGAQNIMWAFQVGFTGSLAMGLVHLTCATHPASTRWRDWAGLCAGAVALAFGSIGVTMAIVVGLATLLLRGWRAAFFHTAPLGVTYFLWWLTFAKGAVANPDYGTPILWAEWVWQGFAEVFGSLAGWVPLGALLAIATVIGFSMRVRDQSKTVGWWRPLVPVLALAFGAVVFQLITALGRVAQPLGGFIVLGPVGARSSRFVYIVAALMLPLIAIAVSYLFRRWRVAVIVLTPVFILGLVENVRHLILMDNVPDFDETLHTKTRQLASDAAYSDLIERVPADTELRLSFNHFTAGWLRAMKTQGRLPELGGITPHRTAEAHAQLAATFVFATDVECHESVNAGVMLDFVAGDIIRITGKTFDAMFSYIYESEDGTQVQSRSAVFLVFNAVRVGAPHARLKFIVDDNVDKIERCTAAQGELH